MKNKELRQPSLATLGCPAQAPASSRSFRGRLADRSLGPATGGLGHGSGLPLPGCLKPVLQAIFLHVRVAIFLDVRGASGTQKHRFSCLTPGGPTGRSPTKMSFQNEGLWGGLGVAANLPTQGVCETAHVSQGPFWGAKSRIRPVKLWHLTATRDLLAAGPAVTGAVVPPNFGTYLQREAKNASKFGS